MRTSRNIPSRSLAFGCVGSDVKMFLRDGDGEGRFSTYRSKPTAIQRVPSRTHLTSVLHHYFRKF